MLVPRPESTGGTYDTVAEAISFVQNYLEYKEVAIDNDVVGSDWGGANCRSTTGDTGQKVVPNRI